MRAFEITKKDLYVLGRDRRTLTILLALPLVFITILGFSTGELLGWRNENQMLQIAIVNDSAGEQAAELVKTLSNREGLVIKRADDATTARRWVDDRGYLAAIIIGKDFDDRVDELSLGDILDTAHGALAQGLASLDVEVHNQPAYETTAHVVRDLVFAQTLRTILPHVAAKNKLAAQIMDRAKAKAAETPVESTKTESPTNAPDTEKKKQPTTSLVYQMLVPAYTVMFVFFLVNIMAASFLHERLLGTLKRLKLAPITPTGLLLGKMVPFFLLSLAQSAVLFTAGRFLYGMSWGNSPWLLMPVVACTSLAATALGLLVATFVQNDSQVSVYSNFLVITMAGISGCFMPRAWMPPLMRQLSLGTPHAWALDAYDQILNRTVPNTTVVAQSCAALACFAIGYFLLGWMRYRAAD